MKVSNSQWQPSEAYPEDPMAHICWGRRPQLPSLTSRWCSPSSSGSNSQVLRPLGGNGSQEGARRWTLGDRLGCCSQYTWLPYNCCCRFWNSWAQDLLCVKVRNSYHPFPTTTAQSKDINATKNRSYTRAPPGWSKTNCGTKRKQRDVDPIRSGHYWQSILDLDLRYEWLQEHARPSSEWQPKNLYN